MLVQLGGGHLGLGAPMDYVNRASNEVHTLTLADSIYELWGHLKPRDRARLFDVLDAY